MKLLITLLFFCFVFIPSVTAHCGTCSAGHKKEGTCSACKDGKHDKKHCEKREGEDGQKKCACCNERENDNPPAEATDSSGADKAPAAPSAAPSTAQGSKAPVAPAAPPEATPPPAEKKK